MDLCAVRVWQGNWIIELKNQSVRGHVGLVIVASVRILVVPHRGFSLGFCSEVCFSRLCERLQRLLDWRWSSSASLLLEVELNITRRTQISDSLPAFGHNFSLGSSDVPSHTLRGAKHLLRSIQAIRCATRIIVRYVCVKVYRSCR